MLKKSQCQFLVKTATSVQAPDAKQNTIMLTTTVIDAHRRMNFIILRTGK